MFPSDHEKRLYEKIQQAVENIIKLCGSSRISDVLSDMDEGQYETYEKEYHKITYLSAELVKLREKPFDAEDFLEQLPDREFWENVKEDVSRAVNSFFETAPYRKLDEQARLACLGKSFELIYLQRESRKFLAETLQDALLANAVYEILMESEYMIVSNYASRRLFKNFLIEKTGLNEKDLDVIWDLYEQNFSEVFTYVTLKNNFRLIGHIRRLTERIEELEDYLFMPLGEDE